MREIKFRGKDLNTGEWAVCDLHTLCDKPHLHTEHTCFPFAGKRSFIDAETIGQFTGLRDKSGKDIYEGDIVQNGDAGFFYVIEWVETQASFLGKQVGSSSFIGLAYWLDNLHVVGNIHDNPDFLRKPVRHSDKKDYKVLLPREFRIKAICDNGCDCLKGIEYVACFLTKADGVGKSGKVRIWSCNSWVYNGKRYGSFTEWSCSVLCNYELVSDAVSPEAKKLVGKYFK